LAFQSSLLRAMDMGNISRCNILNLYSLLTSSAPLLGLLLFIFWLSKKRIKKTPRCARLQCLPS